MNNIVSSNHLYNIDYELETLENIIKWRERKIELNNISSTTIQARKIKFNENLFFKSLQNTSSLFKTFLKDRIKPFQMTQWSIMVFLSLFEEHVNKYLIHYGEDHNFFQQWTEFRICIAKYRYSEKSEELRNLILQFIKKIENRKESIGQNEKSFNENEWNALESIFLHPDLSDIELLRFFLQKNSELSLPKFPIAIEHLKVGYSESIIKIKKNLSLFLEITQDLLLPYTKFKQHQYFNPTIRIVNFIKKNRHIFFRLLTKIDRNSIDLIINSKNALTDFSKLFTSMVRNSSESFMLGDNSTLIKILETAFLLYHDSLKNSNDAKTPICAGPIEGVLEKSTYKDFETFLKAQRAILECHILLDTFVGIYVNYIAKLFFFIESWHKKISKLPNYKKIIHQTQCNQIEPIFDVDKVVELINGPTKNTRNKKQKEKIVKIEKTIQKTTETTIQSSNLLKNEEIVKKIIKKNKEISDIKKVNNINLEDWTKTIEVCDSGVFKIALRQSYLHLQDLHFLHEKLSNLKQTLHFPFYVTTFISAIYYHLEQLIRYNNSLENKESELLVTHNLKYLIKSLIKEKECPEIIKTFYLANIWSHSYYNDRNSWLNIADENYPIPEILNQLVEVHENPHSKIAKQFFEDCFKHYNDTIDFSNKWKPLSKGQKNKVNDNLIAQSLNSSVKFDIKKLKNIQNECSKIYSKLPFFETNPVFLKFKQLDKDLNMLMFALEELNKISKPEELSFYIRQVFSYQHRVMEGLLHIIEYLETDSTDWNHHLNALYEKIQWNTKNKKNLEFLSKYFVNLNNLYRYPFESIEVQSPIHQLILASELIKEQPELAEGFALTTGGNGTVRTDLNFIPLSQNQFSVDGILNETKAIIEQCVYIINSQFIPQLTYFLET